MTRYQRLLKFNSAAAMPESVAKMMLARIEPDKNRIMTNGRSSSPYATTLKAQVVKYK
jgi:hypothetical protein